jgi:hypothetical protein
MFTNTIIKMNTQEILEECTIDGTVVKLPEGQLERKQYMDVKKHLEGIGGKWKGGKVAGFVFPSDPSELLGRVQAGEKVNLKKDFQFFGTPDELADRLVSLAKITTEDMILEPSAGDGSILKAIQRSIDYLIHMPCYYELMPQNRLKLEEIDFIDDLGEDFMTHNSLKFDKIIANPPFTKHQDIEHLRHMYDHLLTEGTVVCITSISWMQGTQKKPTAFRDWLADDAEGTSDNFDWGQFSRIGTDTQFYRKNGDRVYIEMVESGAFKQSGTSVKTAIVVIEKPNALS